jgi:hypothetical protein
MSEAAGGPRLDREEEPVSVTPIDSRVTVRALERRSSAAYRHRRETMADYHEAEAAFWCHPSVKTQEEVDVARSAARRAQRAYAATREALDQARQVARAA